MNSQRTDVTSPEFDEEFRKELYSYKKGDLEKLIKDDFGIDDIMSVEFPAITDRQIENFNEQLAGGSVDLMQHKLMTSKDIESIFSSLDSIHP